MYIFLTKMLFLVRENQRREPGVFFGRKLISDCDQMFVLVLREFSSYWSGERARFLGRFPGELWALGEWRLARAPASQFIKASTTTVDLIVFLFLHMASPLRNADCAHRSDQSTTWVCNSGTSMTWVYRRYARSGNNRSFFSTI